MLAACIFMPLFKPTTDKTVKRLRWVMVGVILFDFINTVLGQPSSYWQHAETAKEGNPFVRFIMNQGYVIHFAYKLIYTAVFFAVASVAPKRLALAVIFTLMFGHYYGASTWLRGRWQFGFKGPLIYSIVLGIVVAFCAFSPEGKSVSASHRQKPENDGSDVSSGTERADGEEARA